MGPIIGSAPVKGEGDRKSLPASPLLAQGKLFTGRRRTGRTVVEIATSSARSGLLAMTIHAGHVVTVHYRKRRRRVDSRFHGNDIHYRSSFDTLRMSGLLTLTTTLSLRGDGG